MFTLSFKTAFYSSGMKETWLYEILNFYKGLERIFSVSLVSQIYLFCEDFPHFSITKRNDHSQFRNITKYFRMSQVHFLKKSEETLSDNVGSFNHIFRGVPGSYFSNFEQMNRQKHIKGYMFWRYFCQSISFIA